MTKFGFIAPEKSHEVKIDGKFYPVVQAGKGTPCLLICLGTPSFRTLSKEFAKNFTLYSSDMYWVDEQGLACSQEVTIDTIIDDIKKLGEALNLKRYIIFAHSAYGIIALEFAKKYPNIAAGIIMVGTPINCNSEVAALNEKTFQELADENRKSIDSLRRKNPASENPNTLTSMAQWLKDYIYRDAPRYWHIPDFDCSELWTDIHLDKLFIRLFNHILPNINALKNLEKITTPIFLAAGMSDFDCCPWYWENITNLPEKFTLVKFTQSGHWPHYEEAELFDRAIIQWCKNLI